MNFSIREARPEDVADMMRLVHELAEFEKLPLEVKTTEKQMLIEGFGPVPAFRAVVAVVEGIVQGMSVFYFSYSTWKGRSVYIDDIIVSEKFRGNGIGSALMEETIRIAKKEKAGKLHWQVLDWNEKAIRFYNKYQARYEFGWLNCSITDFSPFS